MGRRAHKGDAVVTAHLSKAVVFRQESVAGMDGIDPAGSGRRQDVGDIEVAL